MAPYLYSQLAVDQIRILTLSSQLSSRLVVSIDTVNFTAESAPRYEALSYAWGSSRNWKHLKVEPSQVRESEDVRLQKNSRESSVALISPKRRLDHVITGDFQQLKSEPIKQTISITATLLNALRYLQLKNQPRRLWIDAICINQKDLVERSQQVKLIASIYKKADRVVIWLGPGNEKTSRSIAILRDLSTRINVNFETLEISPVTAKDSSWADPSVAFPFDRSVWKSLNHLANSPWFHRLWIWQEARANPERAVLICGKVMLQWQAFRRAVLCIGLNRSQKVVAFRGFFGPAFRVSEPLYRPSLLELIYQTRACECSEEVDRIYAVLGLVDESQNCSIEPDYTKSIVDIFKSVIFQELRQDATSGVLAFCMMRTKSRRNKFFSSASIIRSRTPRSTDIPTWIPDWIGPRYYRILPVANAHLGTIATWLNDVSSRLKVFGVESGTVDSIHEFRGHLAWVKWVDEIRRLMPQNANKRDYSMAGGTVFDAYYRTLCGDEFSDVDMRWEETVSIRNSVKESLLRWFCYRQQVNRISTVRRKRRSSIIPPEISASDLEYHQRVTTYSRERAILVTKEGYICLGPKTARKGDKICVILGCGAPLVLRPTDNDTYQVVGSCYVHGLMNGEALLGPLPQRFLPIMTMKRSDPNFCYADLETGRIQADDPRLPGLLPDGWRIGKHDNAEYINMYVNDDERIWTFEHPKLKPVALRERGVDIRVFALV